MSICELPEPCESRVHVAEELFDFSEVNEKNLSVRERGRRLFLVSVATGQRPEFVLSDKLLPLGDSVLYLRRVERPELPWRRSDLQEVVKKKRPDAKSLFKAWEDAVKRGAGCEQEESETVLEKTLGFYESVTPYSREDLAGFSDDELREAIERHVRGGFEYHSDVLAWAFGSLVRLPVDEKTHSLMRYRGHTLAVKPTKAGFSHLSRLGIGIERATIKSFEGYCSSDGSVTRSSLHGVGGAVFFDEMRELCAEDGLLSSMFSLLEGGSITSSKAGRLIRSLSNARLTLISNQRESETKDGSAYFSEAELILELVSRISSVGSAAFSRLGCVMYVPSTKQAEYACRRAEDFEEYVRNQAKLSAIVKTLFDDEEKFAALFFAAQSWLETHLDDYESELGELAKGAADRRIAQLISGQKEAYRHARGEAFARACARMAPEIWRSENPTELFSRVLEVAEDELRELVSVNLASLRAVVEVVSAAGYSDERLNTRLRMLAYYYKPPLLCAVELAASGSPITGEAIRVCWEAIPKDSREQFAPGYAAFSRWEYRITKRPRWAEKFGGELREFGFETLTSGRCWSDLQLKVSEPGLIARLRGLENWGNWGNRGNIDVKPSSPKLPQSSPVSESMTVPASPIQKVGKTGEHGFTSEIPHFPQIPQLEGGRGIPTEVSIPKARTIRIKALEFIPRFVASNGAIIGPLKTGAIAELPTNDAQLQLLLKRGYAEELGGGSA